MRTDPACRPARWTSRRCRLTVVRGRRLDSSASCSTCLGSAGSSDNRDSSPSPSTMTGGEPPLSRTACCGCAGLRDGCRRWVAGRTVELDVLRSRARLAIAGISDQLQAEAREKNDGWLAVRRATLERTLAARSESASSLLEDATDDRIVRMRRAEIENLEADLARRLADLEHQRDRRGRVEPDRHGPALVADADNGWRTRSRRICDSGAATCSQNARLMAIRNIHGLPT